MLRLTIKGSKKTAQREAARRGIGVRDCKPAKFGKAVHCSAPCVSEERVARWYAADLEVPKYPKTKIREGRGYAPGALLHYSSRACGDLGRPRRRR